MSLFKELPFIPPDAIFALTAEYVLDKHPQKVNLGQGTYRDENAQPWILPSVAAARKRLADRGLIHEYLPILGIPEFRNATSKAVLGNEIYSSKKNLIASCQSISGTGALHLAGVFLKKSMSKDTKVFIPEPTWSNHHQVYTTLGFPCQSFQYYDSKTKSIDMASYMNALKTAPPGSIFILHACAHNPTGLDPTEEQWKEIGKLMKERKLFPIFDSAYLGFNSGDYDKDAFAIRYFVNELELETVVCISFAKNMGLYGERVGCTIIVTNDETSAKNSQTVLENMQRSEISNPPAYGAKIASEILNDEELRKMWYQDLRTMSDRIRGMRSALYDQLNSAGAPGTWDHLVAQSGMFGFLGLPKKVVIDLKERHHVYMAENSRISIAGLNPSNVKYVAECVAESLKKAGVGSSKI